MTIFADIDWLTCVFPDGWRLQPLDGELPFSQWKPRNGAYGYNQGLLDDLTGATMFWSSDRKGMGTCYVLPAQTLSKLATLSRSTSYLFAVSRLGFDMADATRLDVRIDIPDRGVSAHEFGREVSRDRVVCSAHRKYLYSGVGGTAGLTVYLGSKTSSSYVRVYDKEAESRGASPYTRVEVQCRSERARRAWMALTALEPASDPSPVIRQIIASHVQRFNVPVLDDILTGVEPFDFRTEREPQWDTKRWLERQVLPTFIKDAADHHGDAQLLKWFNALVWQRLHPSE